MKLSDVLEQDEFDFEVARSSARAHKTPAPEFSWEHQYGNWFVTDSNSYDGAPDSNSKQYGQGKTKALALADLHDQLLDDEVYTKEILDGAVRAEQAKPDWRD